jgi:hypothetical protein
VCIPHAHANLLARIGPKQPLKQQMPHKHTNENAAVASILLLRTIIHRDKAQSLA